MGCGTALQLLQHSPLPACLRASLLTVLQPSCMCALCSPALHLQADLRAALQRLLDAAGVQAVAELLPRPGPDTPHPRTARVNTLKMSVEEALAWMAHPPPEHAKWAVVVRGPAQPYTALATPRLAAPRRSLARRAPPASAPGCAATADMPAVAGRPLPLFDWVHRGMRVGSTGHRSTLPRSRCPRPARPTQP